MFPRNLNVILPCNTPLKPCRERISFSDFESSFCALNIIGNNSANANARIKYLLRNIFLILFAAPLRGALQPEGTFPRAALRLPWAIFVFPLRGTDLRVGCSGALVEGIGVDDAGAFLDGDGLIGFDVGELGDGAAGPVDIDHIGLR